MDISIGTYKFEYVSINVCLHIYTNICICTLHKCIYTYMYMYI